MNRHYTHLTILLIVLIATTSSVGIAQATATPEGLTLTVYFDGAVLVDYLVRLDPESPAANVTLFGQVWESILVIDERDLPLDYAVLHGEITVFSLGAEEATVTYLTQDLTTKNGRFWTVNIIAPINTTVILPTKAAIISLNRVPELIEGDEDHIVLIMPAGLVEVTYVIGVLGTKEHAQIVITAARNGPKAARMINSIWPSSGTTASAGIRMAQVMANARTKKSTSIREVTRSRYRSSPTFSTPVSLCRCAIQTPPPTVITNSYTADQALRFSFTLSHPVPPAISARS